MNNPDLPTCDDGRVDTTVLTDWIVDQVRAALPATALPATAKSLARSAAGAVAPSSRGLAMIHRHLRDHADALTSGQPEIPPVMTKLIRALADAGTGAVLPVCSRCRRPHDTFRSRSRVAVSARPVSTPSAKNSAAGAGGCVPS